MNVLFLTLNKIDNIESRGIYTDLLRELRDNNHNVHIISPVEKKDRESTSITNENGVVLLRLQIGNIQKTSLVEKGISTLMLEYHYITALKRYFSNVRFDLVLYSTPPITLVGAVQYIKNRDGAITYLLLKDIFPQNAIDLQIFATKGLGSFIHEYFKRKEIKLYKTSDYIGCMSQGNVKYILEQHPYLDKERVEVCPNTINPIDERISIDERIIIRKKFNIPDNKVVFLYGGNLGKPQGIGFLVECLNAMQEIESAYFLIVGSGTEYQILNDYFLHERPKNAQLINYLPGGEYMKLVLSCDVGLIFLDYRFTIPNFPSRLLSYLQASIPILAATDKSTDLRNVITDGKFGLWCESTDVGEYTKLASLLLDPELRENLGKNGIAYLHENYTSKHSYEIIVNRLRG